MLRLTDRQKEMVAWHIDGREQHEMADWIGLSNRRVKQIMAEIRREFDKENIPFPAPRILHHDTKHVRPLRPSTLRGL